MSGNPPLGTPNSGRVFCSVRAWLRALSSSVRQSTERESIEVRTVREQSCPAIRVLVADDNPMNRMVISAMLEARGIVPLLAVDGAEAVTLACALQFDLILMDLQMPILDGLRATSAIRRFEAGAPRPAVPVVAYSATLPHAGVLEAHGLDGSLEKPCLEQSLDDCLLRWCSSYRVASDVFENGGWQGASRTPGTIPAALR